MKHDPDFSPLASAWIEGTATAAEQRLLGEILTDHPEEAREYAALCRTEALLQQAAVPAASRRALLERMLRKPVRFPVPRRYVIGAAAAATLALGAWALWPATSADEGDALVKHRPRVAPAVAYSGGPGTSDASTTLPPADAKLEFRLRHCYAMATGHHGKLADVVAALIADMQLTPPDSLEVDFGNSGDAPVSLDFPCEMPVWTLLHMMAIQTGMDLVLSGNTLVFRPARKPYLLTGTMTRSAALAELGNLLTSPYSAPLDSAQNVYLLLKQDPASQRQASIEKAAQSLGLACDFSGEDTIRYTGSPRAVRLMEMLASAAADPVMISYTMKLVSVSQDFDIHAMLEQARGKGGSGPIFSDQEFQIIMRQLSQMKGVEMMTYPSVVSRAGQAVKVESGDIVFSMQASRIGGSGVNFNIQSEIPDEAGAIATQTMEMRMPLDHVSQTSMRLHGQEVLAFTKPSLASRDGEPITLAKSAVEYAPKEIPNESPPPSEGGIVGHQSGNIPADSLPVGIVDPGHPGMVISPYAPSPNKLVDVTGLSSGAKVLCPFSGKPFRVP